MSGSSSSLGSVRMCSIAIGKNTIVSMETGEYDDPKAVRYSAVFNTADGRCTDVQRKSKTSPGWRTVWGEWQKRPYGQLVGQIISEAQRMLREHRASAPMERAVTHEEGETHG